METRNYINGAWREAADGRTYPTFNPTTGEVLAEVARSSREDETRTARAKLLLAIALGE